MQICVCTEDSANNALRFVLDVSRLNILDLRNLHRSRRNPINDKAS